ncbi:MAG: type II toxin-antitoxin system YafQ family toxin [Oscillochloridaceae bacterium umkhey_bin13]
MRRRLVLTPKFQRAFRKYARNNLRLQTQIEATLQHMEQDVFVAGLGTHKLSGNLAGLRACSCGYDCRIVFVIEQEAGEEVIVLLDIGTHDEVY